MKQPGVQLPRHFFFPQRFFTAPKAIWKPMTLPARIFSPIQYSSAPGGGKKTIERPSARTTLGKRSNFQRRRFPQPSHQQPLALIRVRKIYVPALQVAACSSQSSQTEQYAPERFTFWHPHASPPLWLWELFELPPLAWLPPEVVVRFRSAALAAACASRD